MDSRPVYRPILRAEISYLRPLFESPYHITPRATLWSREQVPDGGFGQYQMPDDISCVLDIHSIEEARAVPLLLDIVSTIRLGSNCALWLRRYMLQGGELIGGFDGEEGHHWGHYDETLSLEGVTWVEQNLNDVRVYLGAERYSRTANAIRLHAAAMGTSDSDLALLGFVGAIESLFSIAQQELSFRLSFLLAKFLGDDVGQQEQLFSRAREVYGVRSKIAHGSRLNDDEEQAAIQMAERWTPEAEDLARNVLKRIVDRGLFAVFASSEQHRKLMEALLFASNLEAALDNQ